MKDKWQSTIVQTVQSFGAYVQRIYGFKAQIIRTDGEAGLCHTFELWIRNLSMKRALPIRRSKTGQLRDLAEHLQQEIERS